MSAKNVKKPKIKRDLEPKKDLLKYWEPRIVLTLIIGALYFLGWNYTNAYFRRLTISHDLFSFPTTYYLTMGFVVVLIVIPVLWILIPKTKQPPTNVFNAFKGNLFVLVFALFNAYLSSQKFPEMMAFFFSAIALVALISCIFFSFVKISLAYQIWNTPPVTRIIALITMFLFSFLVARTFGEIDATGLLKGKRGEIVKFTLKQGSNITIKGEQLILIMHRDGQYYVTERLVPAPKYPHVQIIPDSEVAMAEVYRID